MFGMPSLTLRNTGCCPTGRVGRSRCGCCLGWCGGDRDNTSFGCCIGGGSVARRGAPSSRPSIGGAIRRGRRSRVVLAQSFSRRRSGCRGLMNRVLARSFLGRSCGGAKGQLVTAATVALLDYIGFQRQRADYAMEFQEQAAGITEGMTLGISTPQRSRLSEAVGAGCGHTVVLVTLGSAGAPRGRRVDAAESRFWRRIGRRRWSSLHGLLMAKLSGIRGRADARYLLPSGIATTVTDVAHRRCRPVRTTETTALSPFLWRRNHLGSTDCHLFPWRSSRISCRHGIKLSS